MFLMRTKKIRLILLTLLLLVQVFCLPVYGAPEPEVEIAGEAGFSGKCKLGGVNPVVLSLSSGAEAVAGTLEVRAGEMVFSSPVELAGGTKKIFPFHIPMFTADLQITAELHGREGVLARQEITPVILPESSIWVGIFSDTPEDLYYLQEASSEVFQGKSPVLFSLDRNMSCTPDELDNFNLIFVDNFATESLTPGDEELLTGWVAEGNTLAAGAGSSAYKNLTGLLAGLDRVRNLGAGRIVPLREAWDRLSSGERGALLEKSLTSRGLEKIIRGSGFPERIEDALMLTGAADQVLEPSRKRICFLLALLLVYLTALTSSHFWGRVRWLFAGVIAVFCALFFSLALWEGRGSCTGASAAVKIYGDQIRTVGLSVLYPRQQGALDVIFPQAGFVYPVSDKTGRLGGEGNSLSLQGAKDQPVYVFSSGREEEQLPQNGLTVQKDGLVLGKIKNPLPDPLENCFLILGDTVIPVDFLDGREEVEVRCQLDHGLQNLGDYNYLETLSRISHLPEDLKPLVEYWFYHLNDLAPEGKLVGFGRENREITIGGRRQLLPESVMHLFPVELTDPAGANYYPSGVIRPAAGAAQSGTGKEKLESLAPGNQMVQVYYALPGTIRPEEVKLTPGDGLPGEIFNRFRQTWEGIPVSPLTGDQIDPYIRDGPLLVRLTGGGRRILPGIEVSGIREK